METNIKISVSGIVCDQPLELEVEIGSEERIKEQILEKFEEDPTLLRAETDPEDITEDITFEVTNWGDLEGFKNLQTFDVMGELSEYCGYNDLDVISAGVALSISISDIDKSYFGRYSSDEKFAVETAESSGEMGRCSHWPYSCIDWEQAAKELMCDYAEENGHYFRLS